MVKQPMESYAEEYFKQNSTYKEEVTKFIEFLKSPAVNRIGSIARISNDDVDEFIGNSKQIKYIDTMARYLESIKSFDDFLFAHEYRKDYIIPRGDAYGNFKTHLAKKYQLKERIERNFLPSDDIKNILDSIDEYFENEDYKKLGKEKKERFIYWLCLRVYIKLCLLAPAKKSVLLALSFNDFDKDFRTVNVNGILIKIPNGLRFNIIHSLHVIKNEANAEWIQSEKFFDYYTLTVKGKKENIGTALNVKFYNFLNECTSFDIDAEKSSFSLEVLSNSTIYQMIMNGTNPFYISQITGISIGQLESKYYAKLQEISYDVKAESEINKSIACSDYYQYL